jgi:hypothetical protein
MDLCACEIEENEDGVGAGVNTKSGVRYTIVNRSHRICCRKAKRGIFPGLQVYYETIKRKINRRLIHECRCDS